MSSEKEWHDLKLPNLTILPWLFWALILFVMIGALYAGKVFADPVFKGQDSDGMIVLYTDPCQLKDAINMPSRATWEKDGVTVEACAIAVKELGVIVIYRQDTKDLWFVDPRFFHALTNA